MAFSQFKDRGPVFLPPNPSNLWVYGALHHFCCIFRHQWSSLSPSISIWCFLIFFTVLHVNFKGNVRTPKKTLSSSFFQCTVIPRNQLGAGLSGHHPGSNSIDNLPIPRLGLHTALPFFSSFFQVIPAICLHHPFIYFPKLWLWFPISINDADWPTQPITRIIKDDSELHYGPSFLLLSILYARFNKHVIPNRIFLQISSWTQCATLTDGKKCLAWRNYLNHQP